MINYNNNTTISDDFLVFWRHPVYLTVIYFLAYGLVFVAGLVGNLFVVLAVALNPRMRVTTNYFITSLATADLLIIIFCLPATLMNNVLFEWYFGNFLCKLSVWINATTVCASVYTLVAVSADRYFAICHTMKYSTLEPKRTLIIIFPIWLISGLLFSPYYIYFCEMTIYPWGVPLRACLSLFPSEEASRWYFLVVNLFLAFVLPLFAIMFCYLYIYCAVARRPVSAVDKNAHERERRVKIKVTHMMVTVVVLFAASWLPFYVFFAYVMYDKRAMSWVGAPILRAVLQWCTLANSCINPILYAYFSRKFRRAFQEILILPCRQRYQRLRNHRLLIMIRKRQVRDLREEILKSTMSKKHMIVENATGVITDANDLLISGSDPLTIISTLKDQNSSFRRSMRRSRRDFVQERDSMKIGSDDICSSEPIIVNPLDQHQDHETRANSLSDLDEHGSVQAILLPKKSQPTLATDEDLSDRSPKSVLKVKRRSLFAGLFNAHSAHSLPGVDGRRKNSADGAMFRLLPGAIRPWGHRPLHQSLTGLATGDQETSRGRGSKDKSAKNELYFGAPDKTNAEVISLSSLSSTSSSGDDGRPCGDNDEPRTGFIALSMMTLPCLAVRAMTVDLQGDTVNVQSRPSGENMGGTFFNRASMRRSPQYKLPCHREDEILETSDEVQPEVEHFTPQCHVASSLTAVHLTTTTSSDGTGDGSGMMTMTPDPDHKNGFIPNRKRSTTIC